MLMSRNRYASLCVDQMEAGKKHSRWRKIDGRIAYAVCICYTTPDRFNKSALSITPVCVPALSPKRLSIAEHQNELTH